MKRGGVARINRHNAYWPLLTTCKPIQSFYPEKIARNSLFWKILPLTLTRSRFCGPYFKTTESFQDFRDTQGGGGTHPYAPNSVQFVRTLNSREKLPTCKHLDHGISLEVQEARQPGPDAIRSSTEICSYAQTIHSATLLSTCPPTGERGHCSNG